MSIDIGGIMFKLIILFVFFIGAALGQIGQTNSEWLEAVRRGFKEYQDTKIKPLYLDEALQHLQIPNFFRENVRVGNAAILGEVHYLEDDVLCGLCDVVASFVMGERKSGMTRTQLKAEVTSICHLLKIENDEVCEGAIDLNIDIILYLIDNNPDILPGKFCDIVLQEFHCNYTNIEWTIDVPEGQSPTRRQPGASSTLKILQVSDVHMDPMYTPNKVKNCGAPVCCQSDQPDGDEGNSCGYWAEYGSDLSEDLIDETIRFANTLDIDYVYFTGDIISHRVWSTTTTSNEETIKKFLGKLKDGFKVPVFPTLGNHEPSPLNQYEFSKQVPTNLSTTWLFELIENEWSQWLPKSTLDTISKGGFYTVSPREGFRIIVLNSNVAYNVCWWLLENEVDPYDQLDWLISILSQAEANDESVHILGHIPTGTHHFSRVWGREYNKIVNRFANTITGQFNGHTHFDQFQVHFNNSDPDDPISVSWNGASLAPYDYTNPSFKVYSVDETTFDIVDIQQWTFNLTDANQNPDKVPQWYPIYSFRDAFQIPSLQPKDMGKLLSKMATNHSLIADYHMFRFRDADMALSSGCNQDCQKDYLCELSTYVPGDTTVCNHFMELYDKNL